MVKVMKEYKKLLTDIREAYYLLKQLEVTDITYDLRNRCVFAVSESNVIEKKLFSYGIEDMRVLSKDEFVDLATEAVQAELDITESSVILQLTV